MTGAAVQAAPVPEDRMGMIIAMYRTKLALRGAVAMILAIPPMMKFEDRKDVLGLIYDLTKLHWRR